MLQWIDVIWLPIVFMAVHKEQRKTALAYVISAMIMMRLQVELVLSTGYAHGILPLMDSHIFDRAMIVYTIFYVIYIVLAHYSPNSNKHVFLAGSIGIFFLGFLVSSLVMIL